LYKTRYLRCISINWRWGRVRISDGMILFII
jgi:hypothetical protein